MVSATQRNEYVAEVERIVRFVGYSPAFRFDSRANMGNFVIR